MEDSHTAQARPANCTAFGDDHLPKLPRKQQIARSLDNGRKEGMPG